MSESGEQRAGRGHAKTKIIATLGPATGNEDAVRALVTAGADVLRLNFSHCKDHDDYRALVGIIRKLEEETGRPIGILADLQGPKHRIGIFKDGEIPLTQGQSFRFDLDSAPGDETRVCLPKPDVIGALNPGDRILLDDGKVRMRVTAKGEGYLDCVVTDGRKLSNKKGFNIPDVILPEPALTAKDKADMAAAVEMGVDWIALSFVQKPEDMREARAELDRLGGHARLMAKIEKPSALDCIDEIVAVSDGVMVARGDLGIEIPPEKVPGAQLEIIHACRRRAVPVIVATQMLESMIDAPGPTRAEVTDVYTAVAHGADAAMLSGETSVGKYPVEAVETMNRIARQRESEKFASLPRDSKSEPGADFDCEFAKIAVGMKADEGGLPILCLTSSGSTALRVAAKRPGQPVMAMTRDLGTARALTLVFGVQSVHVPDVAGDFNEAAEGALYAARRLGIAKTGQTVLILGGRDGKGKTDTLLWDVVP